MDEKVQGALRLFAVDEVAYKLKLHVGQPLANARAMVPELDVVPANIHADAALLDELATWCDRITPAVALDAPDGLFLDITSTAHLSSPLMTSSQTILRAVWKRLPNAGENV